MKTLRIISIAILLLISFKSFSIVHIIKQSGTTFSPSDLTVNVGDIVRWEWSGGTHTTTSKVIPDGAAAWNSPLTSATSFYEYTVTMAGKYDYVCIPHESIGMVGSFTAQPTTTVNANESIANLSLYPNPALSFININTSMKGEVVLSNILGEKIKSFTLSDLPKNSDSYRVDLSDLTSGIYFIILNPLDSRNRQCAKFIKK